MGHEEQGGETAERDERFARVNIPLQWAVRLGVGDVGRHQKKRGAGGRRGLLVYGGYHPAHSPYGRREDGGPAEGRAETRRRLHAWRPDKGTREGRLAPVTGEGGLVHGHDRGLGKAGCDSAGGGADDDDRRRGGGAGRHPGVCELRTVRHQVGGEGVGRGASGEAGRGLIRRPWLQRGWCCLAR
jgi:hypothetical protein